ncbi:hypothetical protein N7539_003023 [Penicillium diatomitis]|uniref:Sulfite oxidase n=1 Tax=Penicillium diatomitis TaxID=2819901 RepID=A0A9X0BZ91_9EURO|nr:uncharacterized protein N7539_003023 [Penicillium diatomitis]KAJ5491456.1 hypothetical protein N7539_003023 [Penicillium diatomitis]
MGDNEQPLNREPPTKALINHYDRNHGPLPDVLDGEKHSVQISGLVQTPITLTVDQLRSEFEQHEVTCALECAGNRRHTMRTLIKEVQGIDWGDAAIMNCKWSGPCLLDVLERAGLPLGPEASRNNLHVALASHQSKCADEDHFEISVPLDVCVRRGKDAILALGVNDTVLDHKHGHPIRVVLPGVVGVRWVKWLDQILIQDHESPNIYQQRDYKILPPDAVDSESAEQHWHRTPPMYDIPINSAIASPADGETVRLSPTGTVKVQGYAIPQGADGPVVSVRVSGDGGESWTEAELAESESKSKWCWVLWTANVKMIPGEERQILSCATDAAGNSQESEHSQWNLRGVGYSGYGRVMNLTLVQP